MGKNRFLSVTVRGGLLLGCLAWGCLTAGLRAQVPPDATGVGAGNGAVASGMAESKEFDLLKHLEIFGSIYKELVINYVDEVQTGDLIQNALDAMLSTLDPYTVYIPEADMEDYKILTMGQYGGIGSLIHRRDGYVYIAEPYEGFPADRAGLKPGDKIVRLNGEDTKGRSVDEVSALLKGQAGTALDLVVEREGVRDPISVRLIRQEIKIDNVTYSGMLRDRTGYIRLDGFTQGAGDEVKEALLALKKQGAVQLILDLRYNGGGLLGEAVKIVNLFCDKGLPVVSTRGKQRDKNNTFYTTENPVDKELPLAILTSRGTASASEIVSGALQDYDRAVIIGERTFGKGLVQNILPLPYNAQLKVTVSKYYIPSGRCVQAIDYSHKDEDGRAPKIPDSLRTAFKTKGGRTVYDGDGIEPDIEKAFPTMGYALAALVTRYHIFDFANAYKRKHAAIGPIDSFAVTDELYGEFLRFMRDRDYTYRTGSEMLLDEMENRLTTDSCMGSEAVRTAYEALKRAVAATKEGDLLREKEAVSEALLEEIAARYYYQKGRAQAELRQDEWVEAAIDLLNDKAEYHRILSSVSPVEPKDTSAEPSVESEK
ncbi:MAG: S41 family peptidase [Bacteroidales bacterium]|nr:S41 family peptidase [Bacteroidales bacterium]